MSGAVALALILTSGTTSGSPAAGGFALGKPGAVATTHMRLSADASSAAAPAALPPPVLPAGKSARQALLDAQADLGKQLSAQTWSSQNSGLSSALTPLSALDNTHVWAAGAACTLLFTVNGGTSWTKHAAIPGCSSNLAGLSAQDNGHAWAVGSGGVVLVCSANCNTLTATWSALSGGPNGTGVNFTGVWGNGNTVYAVGSNGTAGVIWVCSANCNNPTAGGGGGKSTWTALSFAGTPFTSVSGAGGGNPAFVVGNGGVVRVCKSGTCTTAASWLTVTGFAAGNNFASVFAVDPNHVYAVGVNSGNGVIWACSAGCNNTVIGAGGGQAQWVNVTPSAPSPTPPALSGVAGAGGPDGSVWAVGSGGAIWFCGSACSMLPTQWVKESYFSPAGPLTINDLAGITASDPNHAWTAGAGGYIAGMAQAGPPGDAIAKSLQALGKVLDPTLWTGFGADGNHIDPSKLKQVYDPSKDAAAALSGIKPSPPAWAVSDYTLIAGAMRLLALTELQDNSCSPAKSKELDAAQKELDAGDKEWGKGKPDGAVDHYENAYDHANKASGVPCAGLTVSPAGSLFSVANMVPGDNDATPTPPDPDAVLVTMTTSTGTLTLQGANFTPAIAAAGDLAQFLKVTVNEYHSGSTSTPYLATYGPMTLSSLAATPLALQGETGPTWAVNESHYFVITVSLPLTQGNGAQQTTTQFDLNWTRS